MNLLRFLKFRYYRAHLLAFLNGELAPRLRRRIGRAIDESPALYAAYLQQRDEVQDFERQIHRVGQPQKAQLDRIWAVVQAEMAGLNPPEPRSRSRQTMRYGLVGLTVVAAILMPLSFSTWESSSIVPQPPSPNTLFATSVAAVGGAETIAVFASSSPAFAGGHTPAAALTPRATPAAAMVTVSYRR